MDLDPFYLLPNGIRFCQNTDMHLTTRYLHFSTNFASSALHCERITSIFIRAISHQRNVLTTASLICGKYPLDNVIVYNHRQLIERCRCEQREYETHEVSVTLCMNTELYTLDEDTKK